MKKDKKYLAENLWNRESSNYYDSIESDNLTKLFDQKIYTNWFRSCSNVFNKNRLLDVGCGDGSKTLTIKQKFKITEAYGVDLSDLAIQKGTKKFPNLNLKVGDIEKLSYDDNFFDLVCTNFVMEHTFAPKEIIKEMVRVCKKGEYITIICPNYGAPNRCSPPYKGNRIRKLILGFLHDFNFFNSKLNWNFVEPLSENEGKHISDFDTTVEPYLLSLKRYVNKLNMQIIIADSIWENDTGENFRQKLFRKLGMWGIFPFKYWGPQILLVAKKL